MKSKNIVLATFVAICFLAGCACGSSGGNVGDKCSSDADCGDGICLDLSTADDGWKGKVCTKTCQSNDDCPAVADEPDCDPVDGKQLCLYGGWEKEYSTK